jgi:hypothetical protein
LWDRPHRLGFVRQAVEKPRSFFQLAELDGCCTTSQISFVSRLATAGRAPLGIRFNMLALPAGWLMMSSCDVVEKLFLGYFLLRNSRLLPLREIWNFSDYPTFFGSST